MDVIFEELQLTPFRYHQPAHDDNTTQQATQGRTKRMQATARRLSVVSATSRARRRLIRSVRPTTSAYCALLDRDNSRDLLSDV